MKILDQILTDLANLIRSGEFRDLESETLEIKPVPPRAGDWNERKKSVNAFLNTRGGILLLGIKESRNAEGKRFYSLSGYSNEAENQIAELSGAFSDQFGSRLALREHFPPPQTLNFMDGRVVAVFVDELPADLKYCFYERHAYKRVLSGDHRLTPDEISAHEEYKHEIWLARELTPIPDSSIADISLNRLNEYIHLLNRPFPVRIETIKADHEGARAFLERKRFLSEGKVTTLGMLVCGEHPEDALGFRCQLHGYVDSANKIAQDKQDFSDNVLSLMEGGLNYIFRNIQVGVSPEKGGTPAPEYPEALIRETVNNALAHRDYAIDRQVIIVIKPGEHIQIQNPGRFRPNLLVALAGPRKVRRIIPEAKPRNPKLADLLRVYRKWEGRGIGMATLADLCLQNAIDLPHYRLQQDEVSLYVRRGPLISEDMNQLFSTMDKYLRDKLGGNPPTNEQKLVLSYLIKSERENQLDRYTILLTKDNNHYEVLELLERATLIEAHPESPQFYPIYLVDPTLLRTEFSDELLQCFGPAYQELSTFLKDCLNTVYRKQHFSSAPSTSAKQASFYLWAAKRQPKGDIRAFDSFYRKVRAAFEKLAKDGFIQRHPQGRTQAFQLNPDFKSQHLL